MSKNETPWNPACQFGWQTPVPGKSGPVWFRSSAWASVPPRFPVSHRPGWCSADHWPRWRHHSPPPAGVVVPHSVPGRIRAPKTATGAVPSRPATGRWSSGAGDAPTSARTRPKNWGVGRNTARSRQRCTSGWRSWRKVCRKSTWNRNMYILLWKTGYLENHLAISVKLLINDSMSRSSLRSFNFIKVSVIFPVNHFSILTHGCQQGLDSFSLFYSNKKFRYHPKK